MNNLLIDDLLRLSLQEDLGFGDITTEAICPEDQVSHGYLLAKQNFILAGMAVFTRVFSLLDQRVEVQAHYSDGQPVAKGIKFAAISGPTRPLLAGERVALNFLQHLSGIATATNRCVEAVKGFNTVIVDTRKTTPGLRALEKYAVTVGGGQNHRLRLDSLVLIKDNHIQASGGIGEAVRRVRGRVSPYIKIEVETETLDQVTEALTAGADIIMLDNMPLPVVTQAVRLISGRALVEVSGNVTGDKVADLAAAGVDLISSGALTHSVQAADISLRLA